LLSIAFALGKNKPRKSYRNLEQPNPPPSPPMHDDDDDDDDD
jgi:hypothetical protein